MSLQANNENNVNNFSWNAYKANLECNDWLKPGLPIGEIGARISQDRKVMVDISIQECFEIATGSNDYKRGGILYLQARVDEFTFGKQCENINAGFGFSDAQQKMADKNFLVWNVNHLWPRMPLCIDQKYPLEEALKNLLPELVFFEQDKLRLIVIDSLCYFTQGKTECATDMVETLNGIKHIAKTFNCACIFLHRDTEADSAVLLNNICYGEYIWHLSKSEMSSVILKDKKPIQKTTGPNFMPITKWYILKQCYGDAIAPIYLEQQCDIYKPVELTFEESPTAHWGFGRGAGGSLQANQKQNQP